MTYETAMLDIISVVRMGPFACIVCDEGHRLKNGSTRISTSIRRIKADQRPVVTG